MKTVRTAILAASVATLALVGWISFDAGPDQSETSATAAVIVPDLTALTQSGEALFNENCSACHGLNGAGTDQGPPLVHKVYEPGHHGDMAFQLAARQGTRAHHWKFGDMPPVAGVTEDDVNRIIAYVRAVQRANGIH